MKNFGYLPVSATLLCSALLFVAAARSAPSWEPPQIEGHGTVVRLPDAVEQPRSDSKICVDLTQGGAADAINPGLEKVARYVNIYAAAGKEPASCRIVVVLHGAATAVALSDEAYAKHMGGPGNPNLPLLSKLEKAGVDFVVCGQSMSAKGYELTATAEQVQLAVSALTSNVNRQAEGYAFIPLH